LREYAAYALAMIGTASRTFMLVALGLLPRGARSWGTALAAVALVALSAYLLRLRFEEQDPDTLRDAVEAVDRLQMLQVLATTVADNPVLAVVGQPIADIRVDEPSMEFYRDTQAASEALGFNTPSNFHGHLLRGVCLLGILPYLYFLFLIWSRVRAHFSARARLLVAATIVVTSLSQSIFSHPFTGALFLAVAWLGFDDETPGSHAFGKEPRHVAPLLQSQ
jgi:hypothetical protein